MHQGLIVLSIAAFAGCAAPGAVDDTAASLANAKLAETRADGREGILRLYPDGRATFAGAAEQWNGEWRVDSGALCLSAREACYAVRRVAARDYRATAPGEGALTWWLMKRLDEDGNHYR